MPAGTGGKGDRARAGAKGDRARQRVLDAVVEAIGEHGLADLSVAEIGGTVGMSAGHVLYYFGTKHTLFVEALKHVEAQLDAPRGAIVASSGSAQRKLRRYLALYLPNSARDPRWALWIEVWTRSLNDPDLRAIQLDLDRRWQRDLVAIIEAGRASGQFAAIGAVNEVSEVIAALLDGLAVRTLTGGPGADPAAALRTAEAYCRALVGAPAGSGRAG